MIAAGQRRVCRAGQGGGIFSRDGSLQVTDSTISGNAAVAGTNAYSFFNGGGGIFDYGGSLQVTDSTISGNAAVAGTNGYSVDNGGGGVRVSGSSAHASFTDVLITLNSATVTPGDGKAYGGGLYIGTGASPC